MTEQRKLVLMVEYAIDKSLDIEDMFRMNRHSRPFFRYRDYQEMLFDISRHKVFNIGMYSAYVAREIFKKDNVDIRIIMFMITRKRALDIYSDKEYVDWTMYEVDVIDKIIHQMGDYKLDIELYNEVVGSLFFCLDNSSENALQILILLFTKWKSFYRRMIDRVVNGNFKGKPMGVSSYETCRRLLDPNSYKKVLEFFEYPIEYGRLVRPYNDEYYDYEEEYSDNDYFDNEYDYHEDYYRYDVPNFFLQEVYVEKSDLNDIPLKMSDNNKPLKIKIMVPYL